MFNDFDHWKIDKFVKDSADYHAIMTYIRENFGMLKEVRIGAIAASGNPPGLTASQFKKVCIMAKI